ncbi:MAG TPA: hypothetical protein VI932_02315 [Bacteroidota bacterium]|nr:hypothetical protein [Bacteroidota bacterium]
MDLQQIIALSIVAAAAAFLVLRAIRRRRTAGFKECANCPAAEGRTRAGDGGKS